MDIKEVKKLDEGISNIEIEGKVTYEKAPRHIEGDNERGHYDFYSQFVVIDDGTGKIGCNVSIEKEAYRLEKGVMARVKGKLEEYKDKNGEMQKSLKCSLVGISKGDKTTDVQLEVAKEFFDDKAKEEKTAPVAKPTEKPNAYQSKDNYWEDKLEWEKYTWKYNRAGMSRSNGINFATNMVNVLLTNKVIETKEDIVMESFWNLASIFGKYIFSGEKEVGVAIKEATKEEKLALARHTAEGKKGKLELREGHVGLLGDLELTEEEIAEIDNIVDEKEEPGSSYDNAVPFKGKRKGKTKVT